MNVLSGLAVGLGAGALYAVLGVGLTLMARLTRVINFSIVGVGVFGAFLSIRVADARDNPVLVVAVAVVVAAVLSALIGWIIATWLPEASATARSAVTIAALLCLVSVSYLLFGTRPQPLRPLVVGPAFLSGQISLSKVSLAMLVAAVVLALVAKMLLDRTRVGVRLRAVSERQTAAELLGINVRVLQVGVWVCIGAFMGLIVSIIGNTQAADALSMVTLVIPAAAAALVGAFRRLDLAIVGGLVVGAAQGALNAFPGLILLKDWVPIVFIVLFLLWNQRNEVWDDAR